MGEIETRAFKVQEVRKDDGTYEYERVPIKAEVVLKERKARNILQSSLYPTFQKTLVTFALDVVPDGSPIQAPDPEVEREAQSRAIEVHRIDAFDGLFQEHQLLVPPVDPNALIHITQSFTTFYPIFETMANNVHGSGWMFVQTIDLESDEDQQIIREHIEGDLVQRLETDGIKHLFKMGDSRGREQDLVSSIYAETEYRPFRKHDPSPGVEDEYEAFLKDGLRTIPTIKRALEDGSSEDAFIKGDEAATTISARYWKNRGVRDFIGVNLERFEKIREREFQATLKRMQFEQRDEHKKLKSFFENCNPKESFTQIRKKACKDYESIGAWSLEFVRDRKTLIPFQINHVGTVTVRLTRLSDPIKVPTLVRINDMEIVECERIVRFRRFAQHTGGRTQFVWFKEFGDPRIMDSITGDYVGQYIWNPNSQEYERWFWDVNRKPVVSEEKYERDHPRFKEANELLYQALYNPIGTPYPIPRWFGSLNLAQGLIAMEEVNSTIFDNNMVPPYFLLVSGGRLGAQTKRKLESVLEERKRGREKFHGAIVIEAESQSRQRMFSQTGSPSIAIESMQSERQTDATHREYDDSGQDKLRSNWRLPAAHLGKEKQTNRNSVSASKILAEEQVFQPERENFDDILNKTVMLALRINFWRFKTKSPPVADNKEMAEVLERLVKAGVAFPGEVLPELEQILGRQLKKRDKDLVEKPLPLVLIEAKVKAGARSDTSRENPEDAFGGVRPDKSGIAMESTVLKMDPATYAKELGFAVGELHSVSNEHIAMRKVEALLKSYPIVAVREDANSHLLICRGPSGGIGKVFRKAVA